VGIPGWELYIHRGGISHWCLCGPLCGLPLIQVGRRAARQVAPSAQVWPALLGHAGPACGYFGHTICGPGHNRSGLVPPV
jgi:hypothetical protein